MAHYLVKQLFTEMPASDIAGLKVNGWVRTIRESKAFAFVELNDGRVLVSFKVNNPAYLTYGKSYTVYLDILPEGNAANAKPTSVKLTVKTFK